MRVHVRSPLCCGPERFTGTGTPPLAPSVCRPTMIPAILQSMLPMAPVPLPESFRGGCSFGATGPVAVRRSLPAPSVLGCPERTLPARIRGTGGISSSASGPSMAAPLDDRCRLRPRSGERHPRDVFRESIALQHRKCRDKPCRRIFRVFPKRTFFFAWLAPAHGSCADDTCRL